jgi:hypothetical protein
MDYTVIDLPSTQSCPETAGYLVSENFFQAFTAHQNAIQKDPLLLNGDALLILRDLPDECIDFVMTSPLLRKHQPF